MDDRAFMNAMQSQYLVLERIAEGIEAVVNRMDTAPALHIEVNEDFAHVNRDEHGNIVVENELVDLHQDADPAKRIAELEAQAERTRETLLHAGFIPDADGNYEQAVSTALQCSAEMVEKLTGQLAEQTREATHYEEIAQHYTNTHEEMREVVDAMPWTFADVETGIEDAEEQAGDCDALRAAVEALKNIAFFITSPASASTPAPAPQTEAGQTAECRAVLEECFVSVRNYRRSRELERRWEVCLHSGTERKYFYGSTELAALQAAVVKVVLDE